jgi:hypothetical protein
VSTKPDTAELLNWFPGEFGQFLVPLAIYACAKLVRAPPVLIGRFCLPFAVLLLLFICLASRV